MCTLPLSLKFAPVLPHTHQRGLTGFMGGDLVMQKKGETIAPKVKPFSVLTLASACSIAEHGKTLGFGFGGLDSDYH